MFLVVIFSSLLRILFCHESQSLTETKKISKIKFTYLRNIFPSVMPGRMLRQQQHVGQNLPPMLETSSRPRNTSLTTQTTDPFQNFTPYDFLTSCGNAERRASALNGCMTRRSLSPTHLDAKRVRRLHDNRSSGRTSHGPYVRQC